MTDSLPQQNHPIDDDKHSMDMKMNTIGRDDDEKNKMIVASDADTPREKTNTESSVETVPVSYFQMYRYCNRVDRIVLFIGILFALINGACMPTFSIIFGEMADTLAELATGQAVQDDINRWSLIIVGIAGTSWMASYISTVCFYHIGERLSSRVQYHYIRSLLKNEMSWFDRSHPSEFISRFRNDANQFHDAIAERFNLLLFNSAAFVFGLVAGLIKGWHVALIMIGCTPLLAISGAWVGQITNSLSQKSADAYGKAGAVAYEALTQLKTVWSINGEKRVQSLYEKYLSLAKDNGIKMGFLMGGAVGTIFLSMFISYAVSLWFGSWLISNKIYNPYRKGDYTGGDVMAVLYALIGSAFALGQAMQFVATVLTGKAAAGRLYAVIDRQSLIDPFDASGEKIDHPKGELIFDQVSFSYESRKEIKVLDHFSLSIKVGMTIALVGQSGCGKSTIISLLERFYDPLSDGGKILLDGHDLRSLNVRWLRSQIGLVRQEPSLFNGTIIDNIRYGTEGASMDEVIEAAKIAHIHDFIIRQKNGYQTMVGEEGRLLSGGQRQRIAIARAILKNPLLLLLDESTSALDNESEKKVQAALDALLEKRKRTTIIIAHRLSTVQNCDLIVCMEKGAIKEMGTHQQLLEKKGMYYHLLNAQLHQHKKVFNNDGNDNNNNNNNNNNSNDQDVRDGNTSNVDGSIHSVGITKKEKSDYEEKEFANNLIEVNPKITPSSILMDQFEPSQSRIIFHADAAQHDHSSPSPAPMTNINANQSSPPSDEAVIDIDAIEKTRKKSSIASRKESGAIEKPPQPQLPPNAMSRLFSLIRSSVHWIVIGCFMSMISGAVWPAMGRLQAEMISAFYLSNDEMMERTRLFAGLFIVLGVVSMLSFTLQQGGFAIAGERLTISIRTKLFNKYLRMHQGWHDQKENNSGILLSRLSTEAADIQNVIGLPLSTTAQSIALVVVGFAMAISSGWKMALVVLSVTPLLIFGQYLQFELWYGVNDKKKEAIESAMELANEAITNLRTVVAFGGEDRVINHFDSVLEKEYSATMRSGHLSGLGFGFSQFIQIGLYSLGFWYGGKLISDGEYSIDNVFSVYFTIELSTMGLGQASSQMGRYPPAVTAANNVIKTLDTKTEIDPLPSDNDSGDNNVSNNSNSKNNDIAVMGETPHITNGEIVFENVCFRYPTRTNQSILNNFNLRIPARSSLAIVGGSGNGKSTIISLLEQFYRPDSGRILIDGQDISRLNVSSYRAHLGLVSQEPVLFNTSVEENIRFGAKPDHDHDPSSPSPSSPLSSIDDIHRVAKAANIHDFIEKLPQKYKTEIGSKANLNVSGGQKSRLAIARALLRSPKILLLDEATSALDNESEALVEQALQEASRGVTTVMIAHRLTSVMRADAICVLEKGVIAEGPATHDELLKKNGLYANLWKAQAAAH